MEGELLHKQRKILLFMSKRMFESELYDSSLGYMKQAIDMDSRMTQKQRIFFLNLVQAIVNPIRNNLKHLKENIAKEIPDRKNRTNDAIKGIIGSQYDLLKVLCQDVLSIIDQQLIPGCTGIEDRVDLLRLQGDLYRYVSEFAPETQKRFFTSRADSVYSMAYDIAKTELTPHSLCRLSLVMNRSIFLADIMHKHTDAVLFAESEVSMLMGENVELSEASYQKAMVFARKLGNKIIQWKE